MSRFISHHVSIDFNIVILSGNRWWQNSWHNLVVPCIFIIWISCDRTGIYIEIVVVHTIWQKNNLYNLSAVANWVLRISHTYCCFAISVVIRNPYSFVMYIIRLSARLYIHKYVTTLLFTRLCIYETNKKICTNPMEWSVFG